MINIVTNVTLKQFGSLELRRISLNDIVKIWDWVEDRSVDDKEFSLRVIYNQISEPKCSWEEFRLMGSDELETIISYFGKSEGYVSEYIKDDVADFAGFRKAFAIRRQKDIDTMRPLANMISQVSLKLKPNKELENTIQRLSEAASAIQENFVKPLRDLGVALGQMVVRYEPVLRDVFEKLRIVVEVSVHFELNKTTGWWNIDELLDGVPKSEIMKAKRDEHTHKTFTMLVIDRLRQNNNEKLRQLREGWDKCEILEERRKQIILDGLEAHIEGKYTLSVPAILPQIEYVFGNKIRVNGKSLKEIFGQIYLKEDNDEQLDVEDANAEIAKELYFELFPIYYCYDQILFANIKKRKRQQKVNKDLLSLSSVYNRPLILHGESAEYATEEVSTRVVLFLDKLLRISSALMRS